MKLNPKSIECISLFGKYAIASMCKDPVLEKKYALELTQFVLKDPEFEKNFEKDPGDEPTK